MRNVFIFQRMSVTHVLKPSCQVILLRQIAGLCWIFVSQEAAVINVPTHYDFKCLMLCVAFRLGEKLSSVNTSKFIVRPQWCCFICRRVFRHFWCRFQNILQNFKVICYTLHQLQWKGCMHHCSTLWKYYSGIKSCQSLIKYSGSSVKEIHIFSPFTFWLDSQECVELTALT